MAVFGLCIVDEGQIRDRNRFTVSYSSQMGSYSNVPIQYNTFDEQFA